MRVRYDWSAVQRYHDAGHGRDACIAAFGFTLDAWYKAIRFGRLVAAVERRTIDSTAVQAHYDAGHIVRACARTFGFALAAWSKAVTRGDVKARSLRKSVEELALKGSGNRKIIKRRLIEAGVLRACCYFCGIAEWRGKALTLEIDHINGDGLDYQAENLRILCPNCHSQTETFGGRNRASHSRVV